MARAYEKIVQLLKENMTEKGFYLWSEIDKRLPNIWDLPTSSTGKYHLKRNGEVQTQAEHTYDLLYAASKIIRLFNIKPKTADADKIFLAIVLHDAMKYGPLGNRRHTDPQHDKTVADMVCQNRRVFTQVLNEQQFEVLEEALRFHAGRWSTDVTKNAPFSFTDYNPETFFVHILDMLSTAGLLYTDLEDEND